MLVNEASRLAAVQVGAQKYIVLEYRSNEHFKKGDELDCLRQEYGDLECTCLRIGYSVSVTILSSAMSFEKAKLVVAPWQNSDIGRVTPVY